MNTDSKSLYLLLGSGIVTVDVATCKQVQQEAQAAIDSAQQARERASKLLANLEAIRQQTTGKAA